MKRRDLEVAVTITVRKAGSFGNPVAESKESETCELDLDEATGLARLMVERSMHKVARRLDGVIESEEREDNERSQAA
jgi:hypothetical protein